MSTTAEVAAPKREQEPTVHHDSQEEYESAEEIEGEYDEDEVEEIEIEEEVEEEEEIEEDDDEEEEDEEGLDSKQKEKPLDDDEDRKNPQFIPKKGYFYEHDDRTRIDDAEETTEEATEQAKKELEKPKKPADSVDKWTHDKFDESEQAPKSRDELANAYGYDIRSEDQPPRARRRRRYGRGPTKYTRRWEEEEAYQKPRGGYRGRGGRGFFRGSNRERRLGSKEEFEEEFPELGNSSSKVSGGEKDEIQPSAKSTSTTSARRDSKEQPAPLKRDTERGPPPDNRNRDNNPPPPRRDNNRNSGRGDRDDRDYDNYSSRGGGGRGGRGGGNNSRGRGRRSEFTNRNRYPNRRDYRDDDYIESNNSTLRDGGGGGKFGGGRPSNRDNNYEGRDRDYNNSKPKPVTETTNNSRRTDQREYRAIVNGTGGGRGDEVKQKQYNEKPSQHQPQQQQRVPPFTNTEYPAPTKAVSNNNRGGGGGGSGPNSSRQPHQQHHHHHDVRHQNNMVEREERHREPNDAEPQKEVRDLREKLNAMRMQKGYQNQNNDRRSQMPPRMQQQQQQQHQQPSPQPPQQVDPSAKPRRYSTQRERPQVPQQAAIVTSGGMVIPNAVAPSMAQGVPAMVPVVTMTDGVVPSTVAAYQPANYYEGTQVYEASASPVTGSGPSVSPSLWTPHASAYATAPYPSPPTAPQVPQPHQYADPTAFIGPAGPAIYAAPPQFLQDPTLLNYSAPAPAFPPPYHAHPQGFQGYAQVTPAPPPEVYHGGVTYYSTQTQIQRPPMMAPQKRQKSVLQLVEPPEKSKSDKGPKSAADPSSQQHSEQTSSTTELGSMNPIPENPTEAGLSKKVEEVSLEAKETIERKPSPLREFNEETSWAAEMELNSSFSEDFGMPKEDDKATKEISSTSAENHKPPEDKPKSEAKPDTGGDTGSAATD